MYFGKQPMIYRAPALANIADETRFLFLEVNNNFCLNGNPMGM